MSNNTNRAQRAPCALHHLQRPDQKELGYDGLTLEEREMAFMHWVAYIRTVYEDVSIKEHRMCPLLWCRESFKDLASVLQHVSTCSEFSSGWYWCPSCCRPEQFMPDCGFRKGCGESTMGRKQSKLRRAVKFFKHLGHKKNSSFSSTTQMNAPVLDPSKELRKAICIEEMDGSPLSMPELADNDPKTSNGQAKNRIAAANIHQINTPTPCSVRMGTKLGPSELDSESSLETSQPIRQHGILKTSLECVGSQFDAGKWYPPQSQEEPLLVSPISVNHDRKTHNRDACRSPRDSIVSACTVRESFESMPSLKEIHTDHLQENVAECFAMPDKMLRAHETTEPPLDENVQTSQSQVDEVRDLVHVLNTEWIRRLNSEPNLEVEYSVYYIPSLFDTGAQALQSCYKNIYPSTFKETFALMHLACAIVYLLHGDDLSYDWAGFFQDMLQWQHMILLDNEAVLLAHFVNLLWSPDELSTTSFITNCDSFYPKARPLAAMFTDLRSGIQHNTTPCTSPSLGAQSWQHCLPGQQATDNKAVLKSGRVLAECSDFFHAFEHAGIVERITLNPSDLEYNAMQYVANIEELTTWIIDPLKRAGGIEEFHGRIVDTAAQLRNGLLRSAREVEIWLTSSVDRSSQPPQVSARYLSLVTTICDNYMQQAGVDWREHSYVTDLYKVLAISRELDNKHKKAVARRIPHNLASAPITPERTHRGSNTALNTASVMTPTDSSSSTLTSEISMSLPHFDSLNSTTVSPNSSFSLSSPTPSTSTTSSQPLSCPICLTSFTGDYQKSNYERHMRTTKKHGESNGLPCQVAGCGATLSRSDNMSKHMRIVHGIDVPSRYQGPKRRRRSSDAGE